MAFDQFYAIDSSNQMFEVTLRSATTGQLLTGVAYDAITARYIREGSDTQVVVSVVAASQGVYTSGGWVETGIAGVYQFGIPNAALAAGAKAVTLVFSASGAIDVVKRIVLVSEDLRDALISSRPTATEIVAAIDADPPAVDVTHSMGVALSGRLVEVADLPSEPPTAAAIRAEIDANSTQLAAVRAKIDNLPSDPAAQSAVEAAIMAATSPLATTAIIAALNNLSTVDVNAEMTAVLANYNPPTKAELDTAVAPLATAAELAVVGSNVDAVKHVTDQLDTSAVTQVPASNAGHLTITAGLTFEEPVSGLAIPSGWTIAYWTLKTDETQPDTAAIIQLRASSLALESDGLQRLAGAALSAPITNADGTLTVDQAEGRIIISLSAELTVRLNKAGSIKSRAGALGWDVKFIDASGKNVGRRGTAAIVLTETKSTS